AIKLAPTISEAQFANLLGSTNSAPFALTSFTSSTATTAGLLPGVSGCSIPANIIPLNRLGAAAPTGTSQPGVGGGVFRATGDGVQSPVRIYRVEPGSIGPLPNAPK